MKFLTVEECAQWLEQYGHPALSDLESTLEFRDIEYPEDSGHKVALARAVLRWAMDLGPVLILVDEWGVWPSSEHMPLYTRFREALGDRRPLIEARGHVVESGDGDDALSVLAMSLLFFWDVYVFAAEPGPVFVASHDEFAGFYLPEGTEIPVT